MESSPLVLWAKTFEGAQTTRASYTSKMRTVLRQCTAESKMGDLPKLLRQLRESCQTDGKSRAFNIARAALQSYTREAGQHRLWEEIQRIRPLPYKPRRLGNPSTS